jgi:epoxide hydrolase-like predicted phosphatase
MVIEYMIITFDLHGVIFNRGRKVAVKTIIEKFNLPEKQVNALLRGDLADEYSKGNITGKEFWQKVSTELNIDATELEQTYVVCYIMDENFTPLLKSLQKKHTIAFLSNNQKERVNFLNKKYNFLQLFDFGLFSFEAHARKPDPKMYKMFVDKFDLSPADILFIDDKEENLIPARNLGMKTIRFTTIAQLEEELGNISNST